MSLSLTLSGNEITDAVRATNVQGDGLQPESSTGIWEATTNLAKNGGFETDINYTRSRGSSTRTRVTTDYKFGSACCYVEPTAGSGNRGIIWQDSSGGSTKIPASASTVYTLSAWVKVESADTQLRIAADCYDATPTYLGGMGAYAPILQPANGWVRISITGTTPVGTTQFDPEVSLQTSDGKKFWVDGYQVEQQPLATPYVETNGGTASRSDSLATFPTTGLLGSTGWAAVRVRVNWGDSNEPHGANNTAMWSWALAGVGPADLLWIARNVITNSWIFQLDGSSIATAAQVIALTAGDVVTLIGSWVSATSVSISVNGGAFTTTGHAIAHPALDSVSRIGSLNYSPNTRMADSDFFWAACGTGTLTDADAAAIHAFGNADMYPTEFPGSCTMVWPGSGSQAFTNESRPKSSGLSIPLELT